jgi:hypothetical protein
MKATRQTLPPVETLISEDVNAGSEEAAVVWLTESAFPSREDELYPVVTTDPGAKLRCCECDELCLTPVEVFSGTSLRGAYFTDTTDGVAYASVPHVDMWCRECADDETDSFRTVPQRERTPQEWYSSLGRVQRAVVETVGKLHGFEPQSGFEWVDRTEVTRQIATHYYEDSNANTISASVSRALRPLIDDPAVLVGAYRQWTEYYGDRSPALATSTHEGRKTQGESFELGFDNTSGTEPTLEKVRFRHGKGLTAAAAYFAERDRLGEEETLTQMDE